MIDDLKSKALQVFNSLFEGKEGVKIGDQNYPIKAYSPSGVRHVDISDYRFLEQNPKKNSHWAEKARNGDRIMWILKDWEYIGQVHNGKFKDFRK
jgi:hypothetical protein